MLSTQRLVELQEQTEFKGEFGWQGVAKGLRSLLFGHLLAVGSIALLVTLAILLVPEDAPAHVSSRKIDWGEIILFAAVLLVGLALIVSYAMLIRGQCLCLIYAPERCGAKWFMFSAITCIVMGPVLNITAALLFDPNAPGVKQESPSATAVMRGVRHYPESLEANDMNAYLRIAGSGLGLCSSLFFILFLRSVARCFDDKVRAMLVDLYLMFTGLLLAGSFYVVLAGPDLLADPAVALALGGGWVLDFLFYLFLILSLGNCVSAGMRPKVSADLAALD